MKYLFALQLLLYSNVCFAQNLLYNGHLETNTNSTDDGSAPDGWRFLNPSQTFICYTNCEEGWDVPCRGVPTQNLGQIKYGTNEQYISSQLPLTVQSIQNNSYVILGAKYGIKSVIEQVLPSSLLPNATYRLSFYASLIDDDNNINIEAGLGTSIQDPITSNWYSVDWNERYDDIEGLKNQSKTINSDTEWEYHSFEFTIPCYKTDLNTVMIRANNNFFTTAIKLVYIDEIELVMLTPPPCNVYYTPIPTPNFNTITCHLNPFAIYNIQNVLNLELKIIMLGGQYIQINKTNPSRVYVWDNLLPNGEYPAYDNAVFTYNVKLSNLCEIKEYSGTFQYSYHSECLNNQTLFKINSSNITYPPLLCCEDAIYFQNTVIRDDPNDYVPLIITATDKITFLDNVQIQETSSNTHVIFKAPNVVNVNNVTTIGNSNNIVVEYKLEQCGNRIEEPDYLSQLDKEILQFNNPLEMILYPNPASTNIIVEYTIKENEIVKLNIHDISGRILKSIDLFGAGYNSHQINVNNLTNGIFIIELIHNNEKKYGKLIIQR